MVRKEKVQASQAVKSANTITIADVECPIRMDLSDIAKHFVPAIDHDYIFPEAAFDVVTDLVENQCVLTTGHAGTGKSSLFEQIAARLNQPVLRPVMNGQMTVSELVGGLVARGGETIWADGSLVRAMREGWWIIIDEIDNADANVMCSMNTVTEPLNTKVKNTRDLILKENEGELIIAHPNFRIMATANTAGCMEEYRHLYPGRNKLDLAFLSRFRVILIDYLPAEDEAKIVQSRTGIPAKEAANLVIVANQMREAFNNGEMSAPCSTRQLFEWGNLIKRHVLRAKKTVDFDSMTGAEKDKTLKGIIQYAANLALKNRVVKADQEVIDRLVLMIFG